MHTLKYMDLDADIQQHKLHTITIINLTQLKKIVQINLIYFWGEQRNESEIQPHVNIKSDVCL